MKFKVIANCFPSIFGLLGILIIINPNDGFFMNFFGVVLIIISCIFQFLWLTTKR